MIEAQQLQGDQADSVHTSGAPDPLMFEDFEGINTARYVRVSMTKQERWLRRIYAAWSEANLRTSTELGLPSQYFRRCRERQ